jgi:TetR/AcrR family transcriptional regulator, transcriptional repressor for nem operon
MRKSRVETAETRRRIVDVASREFRANGLHATGVADVMAEAGLSHGGFYRHFGSKDHLIAEACESALTTLIGSLEKAADGRNGKDGLKAIVNAYLSTSHRDRLADGCPLAGVGSELVRASEETREVAAQGIAEVVELLAMQIDPRRGKAARSEAVFIAAAMVGAVTIARIIPDPDASASVLQDVKKHVEMR